MNEMAKAPRQIFYEITAVLWAELRKIQRSKTLWRTALSFSILTMIGGLFMFILKDPELAQSLGMVGSKAQIMGGSGFADWPGRHCPRTIQWWPLSNKKPHP